MLLLQALTGWCCHRPYDVNLGTPTAQQVALCTDCCHHPSPQPPVRPANCPKCMGVCTYVPPQKTLIDSPQLTVLCDVTAAIGVADFARTSRPDRPWGQLTPEPPLRLHLLHQILLI